MKRGSEWLSKGAEVLAAEIERNADKTRLRFDVVIVGSGYGGAVAAARLSEWAQKNEQPLSIAVLERGLEYLPGDFPETLDEFVAHVRYSGGTRPGVNGWRDGLFDLRLGDDVNALVASGLGGGSLINAGVAQPADDASLADQAWPAPWRGNAARWKALYDAASEGLAATQWPGSDAPKERAMRGLAGRLGSEAQALKLTITPPAGEVSAGTDHPPCQLCGNCFVGCNVGAKRTLSTTYLRRAWLRGVEFYTGATVLGVERGDDCDPWVVRWNMTDRKRLPAREQAFSIYARRVVLAAGTFGSTEILMRSQGPGLRFSSQLGARFSTNGDVIGAQYGLDEIVKPCADERVARFDRGIGPTITHQIELRRDDTNPARRIVVQDLTVPAPLSWLFNELLTSLMLPQRWTQLDLRPRGPASPDPAIVDDADGGGLQRTLLVTAFGHDGAAGRLQMLAGYELAPHDGNLTVHWPGAGKTEVFHLIDQELRDATPSIAFWLRNPLWQAVPDSPLLDKPTRQQVFTVHPLGGCAMAQSMKDGAVDPFGRVFDAGTHDRPAFAGHPDAVWSAREDRRIHQGLYVLDGSIVPTSLGINPLLTITALAEGIVQQWELDWLLETRLQAGRAVAAADRRLPPLPPQRPVPALTARPDHVAGSAVRFFERMTGVLHGALQPVDPTTLASKDEQDTRPWFRIAVKFHFQKVLDVQSFLRGQQKSLRFKADVSLMVSSWNADRQAQDDDKKKTVTRTVGGRVYWFEQTPACVLPRAWRAFRGWLDLRKPADLPSIDAHGQPVPSLWTQPQRWWPTLLKVWALIKLLTHFGAPRVLRYAFDPLHEGLTVAATVDGKDHTFELAPKTRLTGAKRLVYEAAANPWLQLTELPLLEERPDGSQRELAVLTYDDLFMLGRDDLPLRVVRQRDGITGLRDVLSVLLYAGRVMFAQHFLSFRKPDYSPHRALVRLPSRASKARYPDLNFDEIDVVPDTKPIIRLRLTRIRKNETVGPPVLLLHGFGSSGVQFTHDAIPAPMAQWLAERGRDVWVGELRTSIGLPTSEQQWVMDDVAKEDVAALVTEVLRRCGNEAKQVDIVAHCIGSAMFCMAALAGKLHGKVRAAVLMQVGPIVHLPRPNRMRGYLGNRAQKLLGLRTIHSTVDDTAKDADIALDRVLGTYAFRGGWAPDVWGNRVRDMASKLTDNQQRNGWLVNAMRSAGVFGQLFQWQNMNDALLQALPDLLGPCNLTTYQQTTQYVFLRRLTNQNGSNAYVTDANLIQHFDFPTLFIQGELNDVFSARGTYDSARLLERTFGANHPVGRKEVKGFGHLDCVVGVNAERDVFPALLSFLQCNDGKPVGEQLQMPLKFRLPPLRPRREERPIECRAPSVGPWLGHAHWLADGSLRLRVGLKVDEQRTPPTHIATLVCVDGCEQAQTLSLHPTACAATPSPLPTSFDEGEAVVEIDVPAGLVESARDRIEVWVCTPDPWDDQSTPADFIKRWAKARNDRKNLAPRNDIDLVADTIELEKDWLVASRQNERLSFIVVACRQAPLLIDRSLADAPFARVLARIDDEPFHHVLMLGDQVYADSLAATGGVESTRLRFFDSYREAWNAKSQRRAMAQRPFYMAADDHEFRDDHNDIVRRTRQHEWDAAYDAMWRYQYAAGPAGAIAPRPVAHPPGAELYYSFDAAGFSTFVCDTRNNRIDGARVDGSLSSIMSNHQFTELAHWLAQTKERGRPRFLALPSPLAPVFRNAVQNEEYRLRCDDWQRYPQSLGRLFDLLTRDGGEGLVLLSGDYHCFVDCDVTVTGPHGTAMFRSITTAGLFSPYEFANTDADELWRPTRQQPSLPTPGAFAFNWSYRIHRICADSGYTRIETDALGCIKVALHGADGQVVYSRQTGCAHGPAPAPAAAAVTTPPAAQAVNIGK